MNININDNMNESLTKNIKLYKTELTNKEWLTCERNDFSACERIIKAEHKEMKIFVWNENCLSDDES